VELLDTVFEVIDMRSFSNLWYWIILAVLWSSTSYWVLGVPFDMITRGRRHGGQAQQDVEDMVRINATRLLDVIDRALPAVMGIASFWFSALAMLGFYYGIEFAAAVFMLLAPVVLVVWQSVRVCRRIMAGENQGQALYRQLIVHRRVTQVHRDGGDFRHRHVWGLGEPQPFHPALIRTSHGGGTHHSWRRARGL
jgi:hypothetical protein